MRYTIIFLVLAVGLLFGSCTKKRPALNPVSDGRVIQFSEKRSNHHRLYFHNHYFQKYKYLGVESVQAFERVNWNSIPENIQHEYTKVELEDSKGEAVYTTYVKNKTFKSSPHPDYQLYRYKFDFFVDVPSKVKLDNVLSVRISPLVGWQNPMTIEIEDIRAEFTAQPTEESGWTGKSRAVKLMGDQPAEKAFDLVILGDGFTEEEMSTASDQELIDSRFGQIARQNAERLLAVEPYASIRENINVWIVGSPSKDSGVDHPSKGIFKRTAFDATYGAWCTDRALILNNNGRVLEMASLTPFDHTLVLVNSENYGGQGGDIPTFSLNKELGFQVMVHELGHSIGMLADIYNYFSDDSAQQSCDDILLREYAVRHNHNWGRNRPSQEDHLLAPNVTLYSDRSKIKWKDLLTADSPVVKFEFPAKAPKVEGLSVSTEVTMREKSDSLTMIFGLRPSVNKRFSDNLKEIEIDGKKFTMEEMKKVTPQLSNEKFPAFSFFEIPMSVEAGQKIQLKMTFQDITERQMVRATASKHFVSFPDKVFHADRMGAFESANVGMSGFYRSSYCTFMGDYDCPFDAVELRAQSDIMSVHFNKEARVP